MLGGAKQFARDSLWPCFRLGDTFVATDLFSQECTYVQLGMKHETIQSQEPIFDCGWSPKTPQTSKY